MWDVQKSMMSIFLFLALPGLSSLEDCLPLMMKQEREREMNSRKRQPDLEGGKTQSLWRLNDLTADN